MWIWIASIFILAGAAACIYCGLPIRLGGKYSFSCRQCAPICVVLGSGGHTGEMLAVLRTLEPFKGDKQLLLISAESDENSRLRASQQLVCVKGCHCSLLPTPRTPYQLRSPSHDILQFLEAEKSGNLSESPCCLQYLLLWPAPAFCFGTALSCLLQMGLARACQCSWLHSF